MGDFYSWVLQKWLEEKKQDHPEAERMHSLFVEHAERLGGPANPLLDPDFEERFRPLRLLRRVFKISIMVTQYSSTRAGFCTKAQQKREDVLPQWRQNGRFSEGFLEYLTEDVVLGQMFDFVSRECGLYGLAAALVTLTKSREAVVLHHRAFKVEQLYHQTESYKIRVRGAQKAYLAYVWVLDQVNTRKQNTALAPNLIHSLD